MSEIYIYCFSFCFLKDVNAYETQLRNLEDERDRFRRELHKYKRSSKEKVNQIGRHLKLISKKIFYFRMLMKHN